MPRHDPSLAGRARACPMCQGDPLRLAHLISQFVELGDRAWHIVLLIVLDEGPASPQDATAAALDWMSGAMPAQDLTAELEAMLADGLVVRLGPADPTTPLGITSDGYALLDAAGHAGEHRDLIEAACADARAFRERVQALSSTDQALAALVTLGLPDQMIATALSIPVRVTEARVRRLLRRLRVPSRNALIARLTIDAAAEDASRGLPPA